MLVNAAALGLALWAAWVFAIRYGSPRLGLLSVVILTCLPLAAGRFSILGVEPCHVALLGLALLLALRLRAPEATRRQALGLGAVVGVGLLMKLTFIAPLLGPVLLEFFSAIRGGKATRRWLQRLAEACGVAAAMLAIGLLPGWSSLGAFLAMAQTEPTAGSAFSIEAVELMFDYVVIGMGLTGSSVLVLAGLVAWRSRLWEQPSPERGCRPATLLLASVVSLLVVHWLVPHKEIRYLLPMAWSLSMLIAIGLEPLWRRRNWGPVVLAGALLGLASATFVFPNDPQVPQQPYKEGNDNTDFWGDDGLVVIEPPLLRIWIDPSDYGLEKIVRHESFGRRSRSVVLTLLKDLSCEQVIPCYGSEGEGAVKLNHMIEWELYARNEQQVVVLTDLPVDRLEGDLAKRQLNRATHLITNRSLAESELMFLADHQFVPIEAVELPLPGPNPWTLWTRIDPKPPV